MIVSRFQSDASGRPTALAHTRFGLVVLLDQRLDDLALRWLHKAIEYDC